MEIMKNTLGDLNNHLFMEMERLNDEDLTGEALEAEMRRAKAVTSVASQIIANANTVLQAKKFCDEREDVDVELPKMLEG